MVIFLGDTIMCCENCCCRQEKLLKYEVAFDHQGSMVRDGGGKIIALCCYRRDARKIEDPECTIDPLELDLRFLLPLLTSCGKLIVGGA